MNLYDIFYIDWLNQESALNYKHIARRKFKYNTFNRIPIGYDLTAIIKECGRKSTTEKFWVLSSLNNNKKLNINWHPDIWTYQYMQVLGHNTWLIDKSYIQTLEHHNDIHDFPGKHFVTDPEVGQVTPLSEPLDIVYLDNKEPAAEAHFQRLIELTKHYDNRIHRVSGVNGRQLAYQTAAKLSKTAWFFAVFAKLEVDEFFNWNWTPDPAHGAKHYIFNALNPVNRLIYGHMAMVAYNKFLTLDTKNPGLDFVMSKPSMIVPFFSGTAVYNQNIIMTWRTAFREALKLKKINDALSNQRLNAWLTIGNGEYGEWSIIGARDAINYYNKVNGNDIELQKSFDWPWLDSYFNLLHRK